MESLPPNPFSDLRFLALVRSAFARFSAELTRGHNSFLLERVWPWMTRLSGSSRPEDYYLKTRSAPLLALPWWLEQSLAPAPDEDFQADLIYATINKYYFVRLVDDLMDGHGADPVLLPVLSVWDAQFQASYARHFLPDDPFWSYFHETLLRTAVVTAQERSANDIDLATFLNCSAAKSCGATIALMAVCCRRDRLDVFPVWGRFWEAFARWNQMRDDLFDWHRDLQGGISSFLLCEGQRRKGPAESLECWFAREGFAWASQLLREWTQDLKERAAHLNSAAVEDYVEFRAMDLSCQLAEVANGLESLGALSRLEL